MSGAPVFAKGRDLDAAAGALRPWLAARLGVGVLTLDGLSYPAGAGVSNETIFFDAHRGDGQRGDGQRGGRVEKLVLRVAPAPEHQMFLEPRFRMQFDLLAALRRLGAVRVPEVLWYSEDATILGQPFFVMRRMAGRVPVSMPVYTSTGWLADATPARRRRLWDGAMRQFAAIHRVPPGEVAFVEPVTDGSSGNQRQLDYWTRFATWALADEIPEDVRVLLDWLTATAPPEPVTRLVWGDARIGNMMFDDEFGVVGVMDWEQASLGDPVADLGWWLMFDDIHSVEVGLTRLDGLGTRAETIELWEELTGLRADHLLWHEVFAGVKTGLLALHTRRSMRLPITDAPRGPFLRRACRLLEDEVEVP
jgi:aminoglycoside phosphotransferase (APT) family kinase protein